MADTYYEKHIYTITGFHRSARHPGYVYAYLVNEKGEVEISATIDYILDAIRDRGLKCTNVLEGKL